MSATRTVIDVSQLPPSANDHRSPIWWGNLLLLMIETTMFAILAATYFYIRMNFSEWPPTQPNFLPPNFNPVPDAKIGTANMALILIAAAPMFMASRAALKGNRFLVLLGTALTVICGIGAIVLRAYEFHGTKFRWDDNAYASVVWGFLVMHLMHLIVGTIEDSLMFAYISRYGLDDKHARDVRVTAVYWYWIAGIWIPLYAILYFGPYWM